MPPYNDMIVIAQVDSSARTIGREFVDPVHEAQRTVAEDADADEELPDDEVESVAYSYSAPPLSPATVPSRTTQHAPRSTRRTATLLLLLVQVPGWPCDSRAAASRGGSY